MCDNQLFDEVCNSGVCFHVADRCSQPGSQACTDGAGHSLGGFTAVSCAILNRSICHCTAFEAPGLTTFYHTLAAQRGGPEYWEDKITNYFTIPNPINMCQKHLGRMHRVYTRTELRTDFLHVFKCLFGSCVRTLNWLLLANVLITAVRLLMGGMTAFTACAEALATQRSWATLKVRSTRQFAHSAFNVVTNACKRTLHTHLSAPLSSPSCKCDLIWPSLTQPSLLKYHMWLYRKSSPSSVHNALLCDQHLDGLHHAVHAEFPLELWHISDDQRAIVVVDTRVVPFLMNVRQVIWQSLINEHRTNCFQQDLAR